MTTNEIQQAIVWVLRYGPLDHWEIATETHQAPFRILAELKALRREQLVRCKGQQWSLTSLGYEAAYAADQLTIHKEANG